MVSPVLILALVVSGVLVVMIVPVGPGPPGPEDMSKEVIIWTQFICIKYALDFCNKALDQSIPNYDSISCTHLVQFVLQYLPLV